MEYLDYSRETLPMVAKTGVAVGLTLYIIFALVIVKQVSHMTSTLEMGFEMPIRLLAWLHLIFAIGTLVVALVIL